MHPHGGYSLLPGAKGETREGGIRVPSLTWWPGLIEEDQDPLDVVQITEWFTTMAKVSGAMEDVPGAHDADSSVPAPQGTGPLA